MGRRTEVTPGGLASVRAVRSLRGPIPSSESDLARTPGLAVALGMGGQVAWRSLVPAFSPDLPAAPEARVRAGTADLVVHRSGGSLVLEGFARRIDPRTSGAEARTFVGGTVALGAFVMPRRLEMVGRASGWEAPGGASVLRRTTRELGANVHLDGHQAKVQTGLREVTGGDLPTLQTLVVQLQVLF
ncbi:MAG: hypothetical protein EA352_11775 [Gemmatimonadales bacterium]|nr:MAG: hypothetical protein EA352_11775 [Gemmatimonadales bacterium]